MSFIWPTLLFLLISVPFLVLLYVLLQRRRRVFAARYGSLGLVHDGVGKGLGMRRHVPATIFLAGITILLFSLARPQATVSVPKIEGTVMLTFDVSGSMAAEDLPPTRMEAAKAAASGSCTSRSAFWCSIAVAMRSSARTPARSSLQGRGRSSEVRARNAMIG